jgi:hypothetical protein
MYLLKFYRIMELSAQSFAHIWRTVASSFWEVRRASSFTYPCKSLFFILAQDYTRTVPMYCKGVSSVYLLLFLLMSNCKNLVHTSLSGLWFFFKQKNKRKQKKNTRLPRPKGHRTKLIQCRKLPLCTIHQVLSAIIPIVLLLSRKRHVACAHLLF